MNQPILVNVVGVGSIGSFASELFARTFSGENATLVLYDPDTVEEHNPRNQRFGSEHIGKQKVHAMKEIIETQSDIIVVPNVETVVAQTILGGIVVVAVDSINARKEIFGAVESNPMIPFMIDARSGEELGAVYLLNPCDPTDVDRYLAEALPEQHLVSPAPCANQKTLPILWTLAGVIVQFIIRTLRKESITLYEHKQVNFNSGISVN